jgi:hypothetical protein
MKMNVHLCLGETVLILLEEREWMKMCLCELARNDWFLTLTGELAPFIGYHVALVANGLLTCVPGLALIRNWTISGLEGLFAILKLWRADLQFKKGPDCKTLDKKGLNCKLKKMFKGLEKKWTKIQTKRL